MDTAHRARDERVAEVLTRLRSRSTTPWALRLLSSAGIGGAYAMLSWSREAWTSAALLAGLLGLLTLVAVGVGALVAAGRASGVRSASGAVSEPRATRRRTLASLAVSLCLVFPAMLLHQMDLVRSVPALLLVAAAFTAVMVVAYRFWATGPDEVPPPSGIAHDDRAADPDVAALVAALYDNADVRLDEAARRLGVDEPSARETVDAAVAAGLVRSRDRLRRVQDGPTRRAAAPREVWLGLTTEGRSLLVFD